MKKDLWGYDNYSHRVILNVRDDRTGRRNRRERTTRSNIFNRPRVFVFTIIITILLFLFLKEARLVLASSPQFIIQDVVIENTNLISKDMVMDMLKLDLGKGLFGISTRNITQTLKKDPDIDSVVVEKILPGTLKIKINERLPYVKINNLDKSYFIDNTGVVLLRTRDQILSQVPVIAGLSINDLTPGSVSGDENLHKVLNILHLIEKAELGKFVEITGIDINSETTITFHTRERITIKLKKEDINERLSKLILILTDIQKKNKLVKLIDLRFKDVYVE
jgi:cell division protein FtsQ